MHLDFSTIRNLLNFLFLIMSRMLSFFCFLVKRFPIPTWSRISVIHVYIGYSSIHSWKIMQILASLYSGTRCKPKSNRARYFGTCRTIRTPPLPSWPLLKLAANLAVEKDNAESAVIPNNGEDVERDLGHWLILVPKWLLSVSLALLVLACKAQKTRVLELETHGKTGWWSQKQNSLFEASGSMKNLVSLIAKMSSRMRMKQLAATSDDEGKDNAGGWIKVGRH